MKKIRKPISVLLAVMMVVSLFSIVPITASAETVSGDVTYLDENGAQQTVAAGDYTTVTESVTQWTAGTYVVAATVSFTGRISITGDVQLILCDGCTMNATKGVSVSQNNSLTICAQSTGSDMGALNADGEGYLSGIGGEDKENCGVITINGGSVTANGGAFGAGIGGGNKENCGVITINGGTVTANGGNYGAGIGGGYFGAGNDVTINGGTVKATGGNYGAGIGGGSSGAGGNIAINGGTVTADGGNYGAGIGGGSSGAGGNITINGGKVTARGTLAAGIGNGFNSEGGEISLCCADAADFVYASSYGGTVTVADGQKLTDGTNVYSGALTGDQKTAIAGKTLSAAYMIYLPEHISGGTVTADKSCVAAAAQDKTVTLTVTPNEGYAVKSVKYNGTEIQAQNGVYAFTMPDEDVTVTAEFAVPVKYLDENGETQYVVDYTLLEGDLSELETGWYVYNGLYGQRIVVSGDVHLILPDGLSLNTGFGIYVPANTSLTIYAQSTGESMGVINVNNYYRYDYAAIGGGPDEACGAITINGGKITANGFHGAAGIGGSVNSTGGSITINGGKVTATAYDNLSGAGIGGGRTGYVDEITINGGEVTAFGDQDNDIGIGVGNGENCNITINGGRIKAYGGGNSGAGINSGSFPAMTTLSYTNATDSIYASSFGNLIAVNIADGKSFTDGNGNIYTGMANELYSLTDVTLTPANARNISVSECANGTVTAPAKAFVGDSVTLTATPDEGYAVKSVKYNGTEIQAQNGVYAFTMPDEDVTITAEFAVPVKYLDENGETQYVVDYTLLEDDLSELETGWYVISVPKVSVYERIVVSGDVHLIIVGNVCVEFQSGVSVPANTSFTIYTDGGKGVLIATSSDGAAIGGKSGEACGNITINGGNITATAFFDAGIGGGSHGAGGSVTINGGKITANGGKSSAGIGGGNGGKLDEITINGGEVTAIGKSGAGIGGGHSGVGEYITINGGKVTASSETGAGIGGGNIGKGADITINGGEVTAIGKDGAGIGGGSNDGGQNITINGGKVTATSETGAGIGGGYGYSYGEVTLSYTNVTDSIHASSCNGSVKVAEGKSFTDGNGNIYTSENQSDIRNLTDVTLTPYDGVAARLIGHSVSLDGDIGVNFYMTLSPEIAQSQTAYMQFTIPNGDKTETKTMLVSEAEPKDGYYVFKCRVAAKEMDSEIKAQIIDGELFGIEYTYSVREYADYLLAHTDDNTTYAQAAPLVEAMLTYGAYAKAYFGKTDALDDLGSVELDAKFAAYESDLPDGLFDGATLSLKSQTTLSLYFTDTDELTFSCVDENNEPCTFETERKGRTQVVRIRNIAASELQNSFTVTVSKGDATLGTITYSPMNYCYRALHGGTDDGALINVVKALSLYSQAAKVFFGA